MSARRDKMKKQKLLLIDGSSLAFRAFYSILNLESFKNKNGLHTNALYSFHRMFDSIMKKEKPTHVLVAFDAGKETFRTQWYAEYKGGRQKTPSEFKEQKPYFKVLLDAYGVTHYALTHYEADDIIGTLSRMADPNDFDVVILSGDRDLIQLTTENVRVDITTKGVSELESYTPEIVQQKYGLTTDQIIDMKGLMGDSSDNYPGVTKVGEKTAIKLLQEYHSIEGIYENIDSMKKSKLKENLINDKDNAFLSKKLAAISVQAPVTICVDDTRYKGKDPQKLLAFYREMNFNSFQTELLKEMGESLQVYQEESSTSAAIHTVESVTPELLEGATVLYVECLDENYHVATIEQVAWGNEENVYIAPADVLKDPILIEWLESDQHKKIVFDSKALTVLLHRLGITLRGVEQDISLYSYLLDTNYAIKEVADVAHAWSVGTVQLDETVYGKGSKRQFPNPRSLSHAHIASKVEALDQLAVALKKKLMDEHQWDLYETIELPLAGVLARMEIRGITVDEARLDELSEHFTDRLEELEQLIYEQAGEQFNINSPKQLGVILFEKMGLPVLKKTKTGYSTAIEVLEKLAWRAPIVSIILEYRQLSKLRSTYTQGLKECIQADGKIHTRYVQTLTQTGRLSSTDPNLQNIPIRSEEGRQIRSAFLPSNPQSVLLASDYSQIELRVLAHIAQDEHLQEAFNDGQDIHTSTAMRVFGVSAQEVTADMRRQAKAVNFGIVYGISDYGLSQNLNISRKAAQQFIDIYFEKYPKVKQYMETIVTTARKEGYVETLFHRRRYLPDIHSSNFNVRSFAERTAMNSPIQGTAADIIKLAMIEVEKQLESRQLQARMLLQVHDELIFEVPKEELHQVTALVGEVMEHAVKLNVPLLVDSNSGRTWYEAK